MNRQQSKPIVNKEKKKKEDKENPPKDSSFSLLQNHQNSKKGPRDQLFKLLLQNTSLFEDTKQTNKNPISQTNNTQTPQNKQTRKKPQHDPSNGYVIC